VDRSGGSEFFGPVAVQVAAAGTSAACDRLEQSRPNPFRPGVQSTAMAFALAGPGRATLRVFAASGRMVRQVLDEALAAGEHVAWWDGRDDRGAAVSSGVYFYRLDSAGSAATRAILVLR